jgi:predicted RNA binding protein YcfA (HicA-like mRNA interferase family)
MMNRRSFLGAMLAAAAAPAIVRAESLMPIKAPSINVPDYDDVSVTMERYTVFVHPDLESEVRMAITDAALYGTGFVRGEALHWEGVRIVGSHLPMLKPEATARAIIARNESVEQLTMENLRRMSKELKELKDPYGQRGYVRRVPWR